MFCCFQRIKPLYFVQEEEGLYYPCSENRYCTADLWLCFRLCKMLVFSCGDSDTHYNNCIQNIVELRTKHVTCLLVNYFLLQRRKGYTLIPLRTLNRFRGSHVREWPLCYNENIYFNIPLYIDLYLSAVIQ